MYIYIYVAYFYGKCIGKYTIHGLLKLIPQMKG